MANPRVLISTSLGDVLVELDECKAPVTVANFLSYVDGEFYDGTVFHRVIRGFMIQGGGLKADLSEKPAGKPIRNEAANGLKNVRGTIAMARTPEIDSATSQFFINTADNGFLDFRSPDADGYGYAVFGKVVGGMDVVDAIEAAETGAAGRYRDVPRRTIGILSARRA